jgi:hypothetical protein
MSPEQIRVLQQWLNEVLAKGELATKVTEKEMEDQLALLHKGGPKADRVAHWRPVVLLNITNQLIVYVINERLTEMVEHAGILTQAQGGFRQNKSTGINACKLYGLTKATQRLKQRLVRVDIDFKSAFNSMSQASLWVIQHRCSSRKCSLPPPFLSLHQRALTVPGRHWYIETH